MDPIKEALTFDDVTLAPRYSEVLPSQDTRPLAKKAVHETPSARRTCSSCLSLALHRQHWEPHWHGHRQLAVAVLHVLPLTVLRRVTATPTRREQGAMHATCRRPGAAYLESPRWLQQPRRVSSCATCTGFGCGGFSTCLSLFRFLLCTIPARTTAPRTHSHAHTATHTQPHTHTHDSWHVPTTDLTVF